MMAGRPGSYFSVDPDPPIAGQPLQVTYDGPQLVVEWQVDGRDPVRQGIPPRTFEIARLPEGSTLWLSDNTGDPQGAEIWDIVSTGP